ncbi:MAG: DMT family transporter [Marinobacterium sp.]|nr:DMT family transporter [Marinobacterium sp.]
MSGINPVQTASQSDHLKADLLLVFVTLLAAAGWVFSHEALQGITPIFFIGLRFLLAGLVVGAVGWQSVRQLSFNDLRRTVLVGLVFSAGLISWITGLSLGHHMGVGAFLTSLGLVLVPVATLLVGDKVSLATWLAMPVAAAGLACLSLDSEFVFGSGELAYLCAAFIFAIYYTLNTRAAVRTSVIALTAIQLTVVGLVALPLGLVVEGVPQWPGLDILFWFAASVLVATSWRFFLQTRAQSMAPASHTALIMILEPVWTAVLGWLIYQQGMSNLQLAGCGLILVALLATRAKALKQLIYG